MSLINRMSLMRRHFKPRIILVLVVLLLFFFTGKAYQASALSFHFVDEEDNIVLGKYLLQGEKLYSDLFSHHQPLAYIFSAGIQEVTSPNTLFLLIKRHREALIFWSIVWGVLLVLRFRLLMLLTLFIYEPLKIFLLGHLFLSESLVVYPLAYIFSWLFLIKKVALWEVSFLGFCLSLSFLLLSPIWPLMGVVAGYILMKIRNEKLSRLSYFWFLGGVVLPVILTLNFISIPDYFFNAFYINFKYYIPMTSKEPMILTTLQAFASPLLTFMDWQNGNATLQVARLLSGILLLSSILLIKKGNWKLPLSMFFLLGLANIRFVPPGLENYSGFHILPWFMALIVATMVSAKFIWEGGKGKWGGLGVLSVLVVILGVTVLKESSTTLFKSRDQALDYYINYSRQTGFGTAIRIMKTPGEQLFVAPDEWLVYWQAEIPHFSRMVNYYAWMSEVPQIKDPLMQMFVQKPPTYFYCDRCQFGYFGLEKFFDRYQKIKKDGKETNLMVLKEKIPTLSKEQIGKLGYYGFKMD